MGIPTPFSTKVGMVYPPLFQTKVAGGKMQASSPPVITPNRSQSNPDDMITLPRPIQSVGMDLHDVSGTSTGQTLPRERRAPPGTHFVRQFGGYTTFCYYFYPPPTIVHFFIHFCPKYTHFDHSSTLKRRPQTSDLVWVCALPRTIRKWLRRLAFGSCGPGRKILAAAHADLVWVCAPPRTIRKWFDAWRFGSCGPGRKILAAAAADLVWVCAPPRTIRKWLRRLPFWILRTRAQDPCSFCCRQLAAFAIQPVG